MQYLDVGCGNGYTVRWAADIVGDGNAIGIDVAPQMIERARAMTGARDNAEFHVTPFPEHTLPDVLSPGRFHGIFSMEVLYYLPDIDAALAQIQKLLRPGGRFACVVDYYGENEASHSWPDTLDCEMTLLGEAQWRASFERAGLLVREQTRLRREPGDGVDDWKVTEGSLLTLGERPA